MSEEDTTAQTGRTETTEEKTAHTDFAVHLLELDKGRVHDDATARFAELVEAVCRVGRKGKLKLEIEVAPLDPETFADDGVLTVSGAVSIAKPSFIRSATVFYADGVSGGITRDDPSRL